MRLPPLPPEAIPSSLRQHHQQNPRTRRIVEGLGRCPEILRPWLDLYYTVVARPGALSLKDKELIRHQQARLFECGPCSRLVRSEAPVGSERLERILEPDESFTPAEHALLRFGARLYRGPEHVGEEDFAELGRYFDLTQITEAGFVISFFAAAGRLNFGFDVFADLEEED